MLAFNSQLVFAYLLGGLTFLPLCFLVFVLTLWISLPARGSLLPASSPSSESLQQQRQDGVDDDAKRRKGNSSSSSSSSNTSNGSPHPHPDAQVLLQSDPRLNREGYFRVSRTPRLGPATESISDYMSNMLFQKNARPKDSVYATLRYDTLYLYESDQRREDKGVLKMTNYTVAIHPSNLPDNEIFNKEHPIVIRPKRNKSASNGSSSGPSSPDPQKQKQERKKSKENNNNNTLINGVLPKSSTSTTSSSTSLSPSLAEDSDQDSYYIFIHSPVVKEDWYLALLYASKLQKPGTPQKLRDKAHFDPQAINNLIHTLHSGKHHEQTRWFNAFLGRIFLSIYKTQKVKDYFIQKITRKSLKLKRPSFLGQIKVRSFDVGNSIPYITRTRLNDLDATGELSAEFHLDYKGGVRVEIEVDVGIGLSSIKPVKVTVVLAVLMKAISGMMSLKIKPPPTNRFWLGFQSPPDMDIVIEPIVADKAIKLQMVLNAIETKIREAMVEAIVLPNMDDTPFFDSHGRGGVFEGDEIIGASSATLSDDHRGEQQQGEVEDEDKEEDNEDVSDDEDESEDEDDHASVMFNSDPFGSEKILKDGIGIAGGIAPGLVRQNSSRSNGFSEGAKLSSANIISAPTILSENATAPSPLKRRSHHGASVGIGNHGIDPEHDLENSRGGGSQSQKEQQQALGGTGSVTSSIVSTGTTTSKWMAKIKQFSGNHFSRSPDSLSDTNSNKLNTKPTVATSTATAVRTTASDLQHKAVRKATSKLHEGIPKLAASIPEGASEVLHERVTRVLGHKTQGTSTLKESKPITTTTSSPSSIGSPSHGPISKASMASLKRLSTLESPTAGDDSSSTSASSSAANSPGTDYTATTPVQHPPSSMATKAGGESGSDPLTLLLESNSSISNNSNPAHSGFDTFPRAAVNRKRQSGTPIGGTTSSSVPSPGRIQASSSFVGIAGILDGDQQERTAAKGSKVLNTDPLFQSQQQSHSISASTSNGSISSLPSAASQLEQVLIRSDEAAAVEALKNSDEAVSTKTLSSSPTPSSTSITETGSTVAGATFNQHQDNDDEKNTRGQRSLETDIESEHSALDLSNENDAQQQQQKSQHRRSKTVKEGKLDSSKKASATVGGKSHQRQGSLPFLERGGGGGSNPFGKLIERTSSPQSVAEGSKKSFEDQIRGPATLPPTPPGFTLTRTASLSDLSPMTTPSHKASSLPSRVTERRHSVIEGGSRGGLSVLEDQQDCGSSPFLLSGSDTMLSLERASTSGSAASDGKSSTRSSSSARTMISNFFKDSSSLKSQAASAFSETKARVRRRMVERRMSEDDPLLSGRMRPAD